MNAEEKNLHIPLLKHNFIYVGYILLLLGGISGYLYLLGGKPEFFTTKVFAILTSYMETRTFVLAQTNILDEIASVFVVLGLLTIGFSSEKNEKPGLNYLRVKALVFSIFISSVLWIVFFLLIYGWPVFLFATAVFPLFLLIFIICFRILLFYNYPEKKTF